MADGFLIRLRADWELSQIAFVADGRDASARAGGSRKNMDDITGQCLGCFDIALGL